MHEPENINAVLAENQRKMATSGIIGALVANNFASAKKNMLPVYLMITTVSPARDFLVRSSDGAAFWAALGTGYGCG